MFKQITSPNNPEIKSLLLLQEKARERKKTGSFVVEGLREINLALSGGYAMQTLYFLPDLINETTAPHIFQQTPHIVAINTEVYQKIAYRESTEGIIAIFKTKDHTLNQWKPRNANPLILIAESPEKPGNIGALLRTADAAGIDAVWIANPNTDLYNPNVIRSSVGCLFTTHTLIGTNAEMIAYLQNNKYQILTAALQDKAVNYLNVDYTVPTAIIVGTESTGLSEEWLNAANQSIIIPMRGTIDSMNVSVAAAILVFEAVRQRTYRK
jgi:RNA methyltransferase, TrmH family